MIQEIARRLRENVQKVIVGKDDAINLALAAVLCEGHILLEDVPGIGCVEKRVLCVQEAAEEPTPDRERKTAH